MKCAIKLFIFYISILFCNFSISVAEILDEIMISGNERISDETIIVFSEINVGDDLEPDNLNTILKKLYGTNFFKNITLNLKNKILYINVVEAPLIQEIIIKGVSANKYEEYIRKNISLKSKSSYNEFSLSKDIELVKSHFKSLGFYFSKVDAIIEQLDNNFINVEFQIDMGKKSKISKITFIGNKIYKDKTLKSIILSEEYKFWKIISGKKYLQEDMINFDKRLLKNHYLNKGYYNVQINTSFAKLVDDNEFELIFNVDAGNKILYNDLKLVLPADFNSANYSNLNNLLSKLKGTHYSLNSIDNILDEIDKITLEEEYKTIKASIDEVINEDKLNITFNIEESEKFFVKRINIFGNNITNESVIRNQLEVDEGDPYSDILANKSKNNLKSLNFFKNVETEITNGNDYNSKIINIKVEEKPTGEIMAGAGAGTDGGTLTFGVKENNYLGKGLAVDANASISDTAFRGKLGITNPNFNNSDKLVNFNLQAIEIDKLKTSGFKTNKNGIELGTSFEYRDDLRLGLANSVFVEKIETNSTASVRQKAQAGNYFDSFLKLNLNLDKRDQKYKTSEGYLTNYNLSLPMLSDVNTLTNSYSYKAYSELLDNNVSSFSILLQSATSLSGDDIKLTERLTIPLNKLRGFEKGKVGPKDGKDFIGGNFLTTINLQSNLPILFQNSQNLDAIIFLDAANLWGVDYDSSIDDGSKIRSSIGIGVDWLTPIGPVTISFSEALTKQDSDVTQSFRFNLGTTF